MTTAAKIAPKIPSQHNYSTIAPTCAIEINRFIDLRRAQNARPQKSRRPLAQNQVNVEGNWLVRTCVGLGRFRTKVRWLTAPTGWKLNRTYDWLESSVQNDIISTPFINSLSDWLWEPNFVGYDDVQVEVCMFILSVGRYKHIVGLCGS